MKHEPHARGSVYLHHATQKAPTAEAVVAMMREMVTCEVNFVKSYRAGSYVAIYATKRFV